MRVGSIFLALTSVAQARYLSLDQASLASYAEGEESAERYPLVHFPSSRDATKGWSKSAPLGLSITPQRKRSAIASTFSLRSSPSQRRLTTSSYGCGEDTLLLSSTLYPDADGCYTLYVTDDGTVLFSTSDTLAVGDWIILGSTLSETDPTLYWIAVVVVEAASSTADSASDIALDPQCFSEEAATDVHPSEASWYCQATSSASFELVSSGEFDASCGCTDAPAPSSFTPAPTPTTPSPTVPAVAPTSPPVAAPTSASVCADDDSFAVSSSLYPDAEGCYASSDLDDGTVYFAASATPGLGDWIILGAVLSDTDPTEHWAVTVIVEAASSTADSASDIALDPQCFSEEAATDVHPSEASWYCQGTSSADFELVTAGEFDAACGCSDGTSPLPSPTTEVTPSPAVETTSSSTGSRSLSCEEGDSFSLTSSSLPEAEGCYQEAGQFDDGSTYYTQDGSGNDEQHAIGSAALDSSEPDLTYWILLYADTENEENTVAFCYSVELSTVTHPADASWLCDFEATGEFNEVTDAELATACGCTDISPSPTSPTPSNTPPTASPGAAPEDVNDAFDQEDSASSVLGFERGIPWAFLLLLAVATLNLG